MWNLLLDGMIEAFSVGPDQKEYEITKIKTLEKFINDKSYKCLQVGVNHPYTEKFGSHFTAIDKFDKRPCIDINCDLGDLPFNRDSFDFIQCNAILEHVLDPFMCGFELGRVAKPGCEIWCEVPFAQPFHPTKKWKIGDDYLLDTYGDPSLPDDENHGGDFWRFTPQGIRVILKAFDPIRIYCAHAGGIAFHGVKS